MKYLNQIIKSSNSIQLELQFSLAHHQSIPHICHFFYTGMIFESQYFTPKNYNKHPKITTNNPQKCKICIFLRSIWKFFTPDRIFCTGTACGACDKYEVCISQILVLLCLELISITLQPLKSVPGIFSNQLYILHSLQSLTFFQFIHLLCNI